MRIGHFTNGLLLAAFLFGISASKAVEPDALASSRDLPRLDGGASLDTYLTYAALNNPGLEASFNEWKAALERVPQVRALPDPRFSYRYYIEQVETRRGPMRHGFDITQVFPWFGKLDLAGDVAAQAAEVAGQRYEAAKRDLFFAVKDAYYEYYYLTRALSVTRENLELMKHLESVARTRYKAASGSHPDVIRAQVELGKLEDRVSSLQDLLVPTGARLNATLDRDIAAPLPMPTDITPSDVSWRTEDLVKRVEQENPHLLALVHQADQHAAARKLAQKQYAPDIALGVNYIDVGRYATVPAGVDNGEDAVSAIVSINIPLWTKKYSAAVREAQLRRQAMLKQKRDTANQLQAQLQAALFQQRDAARKLDLYGNGLIPKAEQSLKVTEQAYRSSGDSFLDLIDAERTLLEFQLAYERALADHEQGVAQIERLVGGDLYDRN